MFRKLQRAIDIYVSKKKILKKAKKLGDNIIINDRVKISLNTEIGSNVLINGLIIRDNGYVKIGSNVSIAKGALILTGSHNYKNGLPYGKDDVLKEVIIEDNVWIGQNVTILGGVIIGEGSIIQAGSIVVKNIPPLALAGGNPCIPFKFREKEAYEILKNNKSIYKFEHKRKYIINKK